MAIDRIETGPGSSKIAVLLTPEGKTALIDAGPSDEVVARLKEQGVTALDLVVVSHHHGDHYGGMSAAIRAFPPRLFLATNSAHTSSHYLKLLKLVRDRKIP